VEIEGREKADFPEERAEDAERLISDQALFEVAERFNTHNLLWSLETCLLEQQSDALPSKG
jgi:hypothetical protein